MRRRVPLPGSAGQSDGRVRRNRQATVPAAAGRAKTMSTATILQSRKAKRKFSLAIGFNGPRNPKRDRNCPYLKASKGYTPKISTTPAQPCHSKSCGLICSNCAANSPASARTRRRFFEVLTAPYQHRCALPADCLARMAAARWSSLAASSKRPSRRTVLAYSANRLATST